MALKELKGLWDWYVEGQGRTFVGVADGDACSAVLI